MGAGTGWLELWAASWGRLGRVCVIGKGCEERGLSVVTLMVLLEAEALSERPQNGYRKA